VLPVTNRSATYPFDRFRKSCRGDICKIGVVLVSAGKNQSSDSSKSIRFGIWIGGPNRDRYFSKDWSTVTVELPSGVVLDIVVLPGFWNRCPELRDEGFRVWFAN
jgi:hypothetical protein